MKQRSFLRIFCLVIVALILQNCSVSSDVTSNHFLQKRKHVKGWHVPKLSRTHAANELAERKQEKSKNENQSLESIEADRADLAYTEMESLVVSADFSMDQVLNQITAQEGTILKAKNKKVQDDKCDQIVLRNGEEISAKIVEVGTKEIRYKRCDNPDGPIFVKSIADVFMIKYTNGTKTVFDKEEIDQRQDEEEEPREIDYLETIDGDDKSFYVAVGLWFFLGILGIHRFYLGHIGIGVLYLLTGGLCGFGWIIDGILFLTGGLKPKRGNYIKE